LRITYSGFVVIESTDGRDAIEKARSLMPDLIVMDLGMPLLDGWEATRILKGDPRTRTIPIIIVTGYTQEHPRRSGTQGRMRRFPAQAMHGAARRRDSASSLIFRSTL